ncbi:hypothetical protein BaRGS_00029272 [Batillaria attramentaria]|uniref:Uncharacterized protein n=1 Tax=Batillaria attramentaria TaxID=370345 RepID=A0ABD0JXI6_9CAEN
MLSPNTHALPLTLILSPNTPLLRAVLQAFLNWRGISRERFVEVNRDMWKTPPTRGTQNTIVSQSADASFAVLRGARD